MQTASLTRPVSKTLFLLFTPARTKCPLVIGGAYGEGQPASTTSLLTCLAILRVDFDGFDFLT